MQFNSLPFFLFLPVVFLAYWLLCRGRRSQNAVIVLASAVFYGWWDWRLLGLIALSAGVSWGGALLVAHYAGQRRRQRLACVCSVVIQLLILGFFKYFGFFVQSLQAVLSWLGFSADWATLHVVLPVGISFYTFQAVSYTVDVYRGTIAATRDVVRFLAFLSFFPQLVAGPIERAGRLLPQFARQRSFDYGRAADGCRQMLWGFFKKMVVADNCATVVNAVWADASSQSPLMLAIGAVLFSFQIYCDFSGYSDIAIGCARLFGISLTDNFRTPYFSRNMAEFWRRWHISLMTWLRDYVYIPLGGNRRGLPRTLRNTMVVWAVSGLWHGANWTFVCWGLFHGVLLCLRRVAGRGKPSAAEPPVMRALPAMCGTFLLVTLGWVLFRAPSISAAFSYVGRTVSGLLSPSGWVLPQLSSALLTAVCGIALMLVCEWYTRNCRHALQLLDRGVAARSVLLRYAVYVGLSMLTMAFAGSQSAFIYFQF